MQSSALCRGLSCLPKLRAVGLSEDWDSKGLLLPLPEQCK